MSWVISGEMCRGQYKTYAVISASHFVRWDINKGYATRFDTKELADVAATQEALLYPESLPANMRVEKE